MKNSDWMGIIIILGIIAIGLSGGIKNKNQLDSSYVNDQNLTLEQKVELARSQTNTVSQNVKTYTEAQTYSKYKGLIHLQYVNRSNDPQSEFIALYVDSYGTTTIPITGWTLKSIPSGANVKIGQAVGLYFSGVVNTEQNVVLSPGDYVYIITGTSPIDYGFRVNKCSGYLSQFKTFIPYLNTSCPLPRDEDLSEISRKTVNDACLDYINSFPNCRVQTENLPISWGADCTKFIYEKINYGTCVNTHKGDKNFYVPEWRLYLKRNERIWKNDHEEIVLYDSQGKIVDTLKY